MKNFGSWLTALFLCLFLLGSENFAVAGIAREGAVSTAAFWQGRAADGEAVLLSPSEIEALNARLRAGEQTLYDLAAEPESLDGETVKSIIWGSTQEYWPYDAMPSLYTADGELSWQAWNATLTNRNIAGVPMEVRARYAVTVRRSDLRLLPQAAGWYEGMSETARHYDDLQATALDPAEPVLVWHTSGDGAFAFVEARDYRGWVALSDLAFTDRATWLRYVRPADFFVVTRDKIRLSAGGTAQVYQMGAKVPCAEQDGETMLLLPVRQSDGSLSKTRLPASDAASGLHHGFLPFTSRNLYAQAFAFLGDVYGWGGQDESVDCSSFVQDVYRSMGIELPRDADRQEAALTKIPLSGLSRAARDAAIRQAPPGALLFKPGHVMLYLGTDDDGTPLVIHCASSYYEGGEKIYVRRVLVSDLSYENGSGTATIDGLTSIGLIGK